MKPILTPRQFAQAIGASESSVKRWVDDGHIAATRTAGGHRRISIQEATRYIRENAVLVVRPDALGLPDVAALAERHDGLPGGDLSDSGQALFDYLRAGAEAEARGLLLSSYLNGSSVAEIIDGPLVEAMTRIGELWVSSPSGIFWEHRATQIAIQGVSRLRLLLGPKAGAVVALGGAPPGDTYQLPSLAAATVLEGEGLRATNLGPETPLESLALAAEDAEPSIVWLSVSVLTDPAGLRRGIEMLLPGLAERGALLVLGGQRAPEVGVVESPSLYVGRSMGELAALVRGMKLASASPTRSV